MKQTVPMRWDLDSLYPGGSRSPKLMNFLTELQQSIENITNDIHKLQPYEEVSTEPLVQVFDEIQYVMSGSFQVEEFLICLRAENTQDDHVTKMIAESAKTKADLEKMEVEFDSLLASLSEHAWNELLENTEVRTYLFHLKERRQRIEAKRPHEIEKTIQSLSVSGFSTWEDHYEQQLSKLRVPVETAGKTEPFSIGQAFSEVLFSDEEERRKTIIQSYNHVCASHADTFASILNNISGFRLDVYRERGWDNVLKEALEQNRINEETVDTMTAVVKKTSTSFAISSKEKHNSPEKRHSHGTTSRPAVSNPSRKFLMQKQKTSLSSSSMLSVKSWELLRKRPSKKDGSKQKTVPTKWMVDSVPPCHWPRKAGFFFPFEATIRMSSPLRTNSATPIITPFSMSFPTSPGKKGQASRRRHLRSRRI